MNNTVFLPRKTNLLNKHYNANTYSLKDAGFALILFFVVFLLIGNIFTGIVRSIAKKYLIDYYVVTLVSIIISQGGILLVAIYLSKLLKAPLFRGGGYNVKLDTNLVIYCVIAVVCMQVFFSPLLDRYVDVIYFVGYVQGEGNYVYDNVFCAYLVLILTAVAPAICEELLFRGIVLRSLERFGSTVAIFGSALIFAVMHGNAYQLLLQFALGVVTGYVVMKEKNLLYGVIIHFVNNLVAGVISVALTMYNTSFIMALAALCLIFAAVGLVFFAGVKIVKKTKDKGPSSFDMESVKGKDLTDFNEFYSFFSKVNEKIDDIPEYYVSIKYADETVFLPSDPLGNYVLDGKTGTYIEKRKDKNKITSFAIFGIGIALLVIDFIVDFINNFNWIW